MTSPENSEDWLGIIENIKYIKKVYCYFDFWLK